MNIIVGLLVGVFFFVSTITAYILGLKHKAKIIENIIPFTPLEEVKETFNEVIKHFEDKKEEVKIESAVEEYWNN